MGKSVPGRGNRGAKVLWQDYLACGRPRKEAEGWSKVSKEQNRSHQTMLGH